MSGGKLPHPCPLRSFTLALFCSFGSYSRRSRCISGALQRLLLQTLIYLQPLEAGASAVLCKDFFTDADLLAARRSRCISGALQKLSFTDADLLAAAARTEV